jgi:acetoacetyl-CoA synthetase
LISCFALGNPLLPVYRGELQCRGLGMKVEIFTPDGRSVREQKGELVCTAPFPSMPIGFWNDTGRRVDEARAARDHGELGLEGGEIVAHPPFEAGEPVGERRGAACAADLGEPVEDRTGQGELGHGTVLRCLKLFKVS